MHYACNLQDSDILSLDNLFFLSYNAQKGEETFVLLKFPFVFFLQLIIIHMFLFHHIA